MKIETQIVYLNSGDRDYAEKIAGECFTSTQELKNQFACDGIEIRGIQTLNEFQDEWNDTDDDVEGLKHSLATSMITYVYTIKQS